MPNPANYDVLQRHVRTLVADGTRVLLPDLLRDHVVACVDGRKSDAVIGAPGGNAGLFLLLLTSLEDIRSTPLDVADVTTLFEKYLDHFHTFYLHTDIHALRRLADTLHADATFSAYHDQLRSLQDVEAFVRQPPAPIRGELLKHLASPDHIGCGHLRLMSEHPAVYDVRPALLDALGSAYFAALWREDSRVRYDVLQGDHQERAVLNVTSADASAVLALPPHHEPLQLFVNHPQALSYLYRQHGAFLEKVGAIDDTTQRDEVIGLQHTLGRRQLETTLRHLAPDLPQVTVVDDDPIRIETNSS